MKLKDHKFSFDREKMITETEKNPAWVHFGCGNIFRALPARCAQSMIERGLLKSGITAVEGYDEEIIEKIYRPNDNISLLVTLMADGKSEETVIGSVAEALTFSESARLNEIFSSPSLFMVSFTITEKGYSSEGYMDKVTALLYSRYKCSAPPVAMISMDNCSNNGDVLRAAVFNAAVKYGDESFISYIEKLSFPLTMIDKITPRPSIDLSEKLTYEGFEDMYPVVTEKNTYIAPFVNAEECEYLVIEDDFPCGRPELQKSGIILTDRQTVIRCEQMKVGACLNPLHTALAVFGCILGFKKISDEMADSDLRRLAEGVGRESLPTVDDPGVLKPEKFISDVLTLRLPNPNIPDSPQRIATDTSQKLSVRFGNTLRRYGKKARDLTFIPLVIAGWLRYLKGIDDIGGKFELSPDPLLEKLCGKAPEEILKMQEIFGVDLYDIGIYEKILEYYGQMCQGTGSVRRTIHEKVY